MKLSEDSLKTDSSQSIYKNGSIFKDDSSSIPPIGAEKLKIIHDVTEDRFVKKKKVEKVSKLKKS